MLHNVNLGSPLKLTCVLIVCIHCTTSQHHDTLVLVPLQLRFRMCRLFENTFQLDVLSARDFCEADDRWAKAVQYLDADRKAGWELLAAMLNPNWRLRPTAQSCLVHRFLASS